VKGRKREERERTEAERDVWTKTTSLLFSILKYML
jgi:hypothetical protein